MCILEGRASASPFLSAFVVVGLVEVLFEGNPKEGAKPAAGRLEVLQGLGREQHCPKTLGQVFGFVVIFAVR
jgi:hypothetical protein